MPSMKSRMAAYRKRVDYAHTAFLRGEDSRDFDNCFEMYDGEFVVVALMRRAQKDPVLMAAIRADFSQTCVENWSWIKTQEKYKRIPDSKLAELAAQKQIEAEWFNANVHFPQLAMANEQGVQPFRLTRKEGPYEIAETLYGYSVRAIVALVRSWTTRTVLGAPFLSMLAEITIQTQDGEIYPI